MATAVATAPTNTIVDTRFNNQYFIFTLKIEPTESKNIEFTGKVKAFIEANLDWITQKLECYNNDDAVKIGHVKYSSNFYSDTLLSIADLYYTDFLHTDTDNNTNYKIHMIFYRLKKEELFTKSVIKNDTVTMNLLYRDCMIRNNITDDEMHKYWNFYAQDNLIQDLSAERIMDLSFIQPDYCKTKYFIHQLDMIASYLKIHYDYKTIRFTTDRVFYLGNMMRLWFNYSRMNDPDAFFHDSNFPSANVIGGIDCTHTGHGKTYCALTYAIYVGMNDVTHKTKTLICVPDHIKDHWYSQLELHFEPGDYSPYITIASYSDVMKMEPAIYNSHTVFIGDELHLLYGKIENRVLYDKIVNSDNFLHRWGITATPSTSDGNALFHIIRLIIRTFNGRPITHPAAGRYKYVLNEIKTHGLLRRNVESTTKTYLNLPPVTIHNVPCIFSQEEWDFYNSEMSVDTNRNIMDIMKFCVDLMVMMMDTSTNKNIITVSKWKEHAFNTRVEQANTCREILLALTKKLDNVLIEIKKHEMQMAPASQFMIADFQQRAQHIISEIKAQEVIVASRNAVVERYRATLANLEASVKKSDADADMDTSECTFDDDKICSICYDPYYGVIAMFPTITDSIGNVRCGHYFHKRCYEDYRRTTQTNNCPMCRSVAEAGSITYVGRSEEKRIIGSKNKKIIELMNVNRDQTFIIFTHFENYIHSLRSLLSSNEITNMDYDEYAIEKKRLDGGFPNVRALILSSNKNACGIDLQEFHNIIIVSPFLNNLHGQQVEKQLIGRCDRIGQTHAINVYRLYIEGTIEADLYRIKSRQ